MAEIDKLTLTDLLTVPLEVVLSPSPSSLSAILSLDGTNRVSGLVHTFRDGTSKLTAFSFCRNKKSFKKNVKKKHAFTNFFWIILG